MMLDIHTLLQATYLFASLIPWDFNTPYTCLVFIVRFVDFFCMFVRPLYAPNLLCFWSQTWNSFASEPRCWRICAQVSSSVILTVWPRCALWLATRFSASWKPRVWLLTFLRTCTPSSRRQSTSASTWRGTGRCEFIPLSSQSKLLLLYHTLHLFFLSYVFPEYIIFFSLFLFIVFSSKMGWLYMKISQNAWSQMCTHA